ncbi:uncharacterized protein LOC106876058 isoform X2 [Octopus bimaculoides]|nr:uncharacterized protein LOC106876058 isoform X2 [Octopus bimaculoides]|eukprot:XP_014779948.1 PREDICTED: uncharacterized protein LOC106876058 isoform X2 [Octopus bimaculoides]
MKRPVVWQSKNYKYECDRTCANGDHIVTQDGNVSTLTIKNISWEFSKWSFMDDNIRGALLEMDIKVKPTIQIMNETDCIYNVTAQCSLPVTHIECFIGKDLQKFSSNKTENCLDGKTYTFSATLKPHSGNLKCSFTMDNIFSTERTKEVKCNNPSAATSDLYTMESFVVGFSQSTISTPNITKKSSAGDKTKQKNYISIIIAVLIVIGVVDAQKYSYG